MSGSVRYQPESLAWVCEDVGAAPFPEDGFDELIASGRFSAHVEGQGGAFEVGPEWAALEDALEWARARAGCIVVRLCGDWEGTFYSAGNTPFSFEHIGDDSSAAQLGDTADQAPQVLPWPAGGLVVEPRRLGGWEFLDRTDADDEISWEVRCHALPRFSPRDRDAFEAALAADAEIALRDVSLKPHPQIEPGGFIIATADADEVVVAVVAQTPARAVELAVAACRRADDVARRPRKFEEWPDWEGSAYPTGSKAARNAVIDRG